MFCSIAFIFLFNMLRYLSARSVFNSVHVLNHTNKHSHVKTSYEMPSLILKQSMPQSIVHDQTLVAVL